MIRHVEQVLISQLRFGNDVVFYADNPDNYPTNNPTVLPEYFTTSNRGGWERVWGVYYGDKNPYLQPTPPPIYTGNVLRGLINSMPPDRF